MSDEQLQRAVALIDAQTERLETYLTTLKLANDRIKALEAALRKIANASISASLDEPDTDWQVIVKMRAIARATLDKDVGK